MRSTRAMIVISVSGMLGIGLAVPAAAAPPGATGATVTITGGVLAISVPDATVDLGSRPETVSGGNIHGPLGQVQVNDARGAPAGSGWVASVISTAFIPSTGTAIPASDVSYTAGAITKVGTATYVANDPTDTTGVSPVVTASGITGDNSATWNPTINVAVPGAMAAGTYAATITHSVV